MPKADDLALRFHADDRLSDPGASTWRAML
jgi:hypothetical protein